MDNELFDDLFADVPKMNPVICEGVVGRELEKGPAFIHDVWENVKTSFPPCLTYTGWDFCTEEEEYRIITEKRGQSPAQFDLARSDIYFAKYRFLFNGEELYRYFAFVYEDEGCTHLRGAEYAISPVLADRTFSVDDNKLFIPLLMTKLTFKQFQYSVYRNDDRVTSNVAYSELYNLNKEAKERADVNDGRKVSTVHTLAHYLLCKYGPVETFRKFFNTEIIIGDSSTINYASHPPEEWVIYRSLGIMPDGVRDRVYHPTDIRVAYRKLYESNREAAIDLQSMVTAMFYIIDRYPATLTLESIHEDIKWKVALGYAIFNSGQSHGKLIEDIDSHLNSLDMYIDTITNRDLQADGIFIEHIYDLFVYVIRNMPAILRENSRTNGSANMYGKQLKVLRYVLMPIVYAINKFIFELQRSKKEEFTLKDIKASMGKWLRKDAIFQIVSAKHGEVSSVSCANDNLLTKLTSRIVMQEDATSVSKYNEVINDRSKHLHPSMLAASYTNQPKFDPTGRSRINTHAVTTHDLVLILNPILQNDHEAINRRLAGHLEIINENNEE